MLIIGVAYGIFYTGIMSTRKQLESVSHMEAIKTILPIDYSAGQLNLVELRMMEIQKIMGMEDMHRVLLDTALSKDPNCMLYTANPIVQTRILFDSDYYHRYNSTTSYSHF